MIARGGEVLGAATISEIHSDDIKARSKTLLRHCLHVVGGGGTLNPVPDNQSWMIRWLGLPATVSKDLRPRLHFKQTLLISFGSKAKSPRPEISSYRLCMAITKDSVRIEWSSGESRPRPRQKGANSISSQQGFLLFNCSYFSFWKHYENPWQAGSLPS